MATKTKRDVVRPDLTQLEAKNLAIWLEEISGIKAGIGDVNTATEVRAVRQKIVKASGKVPDA